LKVLFFSPHAIADSCSGAARSIQALFEELQGLGHPCHVLTGAVTDGRSEMFAKVLATAPTQTLRVDASALTVPLRQVKIQGIEHIVVGDAAQGWQAFKAYQDIVLREVFQTVFATFNPDVLVTYGGYACNFFAGQHAMAHGRRSVLFAASNTYRKPSDFVHVNAIAAVSRALAAELAGVVSLPTVILSSLVKTADAKCALRRPEYITLLNPVPAKGLKLAAAIVLECARRGRPYKFLFVESRGTRETALRACPELAACKNLAFAHNTADIKTVYEVTRIMLYPSVWFETAGQTPIESNTNGVPVLAHNVGGIADMLDGAGFLFDPPPAMLKDWLSPPPADYVEKWIAALDRLHDEPEVFADAVKRAEAADRRYDLKALAQKFAAAMT